MSNMNRNITNSVKKDSLKVKLNSAKRAEKAVKKEREVSRKKARTDKEGFITPKDFVKTVEKYEKKHRRTCTIDEITNLYEKLYVGDLEPHDFSISKSLLILETTLDDNVNYARRSRRSMIKNHYGYYVDAHGHEVYKGYWVGVDWSNLLLFTSSYDLTDEDYDRFYNYHDSDDDELMEPHSDESYYYDSQSSSDDETNDATISHISTSEMDSSNFNFVSDCVTQLSKVLDSIRGFKTPEYDLYLSIFEDIASILITLQQKASWPVLLVVCSNIIKRYMGTSICGATNDVYLYIMSKEDMEPQDFLDSLNRAKTAPAFFRTQLFSQIRRVIVGLVSFGMINPIYISVRGIKLLDIKATEMSMDALDLSDYILDLITYFTKIGYMVYNGDTSFLNTIDEVDEVDSNIIHLKSNIDRVANGGYTKDTKKTIGEYQHMLYQTHEQVRVMSRRCNNPTMKKSLLSKLDELTRLMIRFEQINPLEGLRKAPFSLSIYGLSQVGKSTVAEILMKSVLKSNGFSAEDEQICTLQPNDKFYSTWKQNTVGVLLDDVSNTLAEKAQVNPADMIISLVNNVKYSAPKADTKDKGIFNVEPHVVIATTNCKDLGASKWSVEPFSVVRRLKYHITVSVKSQFSTNGKLDSSKVDDINNSMWKEHGVMDVWWFKVEQAIALPTTESTGAERYNFNVVRNSRQVLMDKVDIFDLQSFLNESSSEFYEQQTVIVNGASNSARKMEFCNICKYQTIKCKCVRSEETEVDNLEIRSIENFMTHEDTNPIKFVDESSPVYSLRDRLAQNYSYQIWRKKHFKRKDINNLDEDGVVNLSYDDDMVLEQQDSIITKTFYNYISNKMNLNSLLYLQDYCPVPIPWLYFNISYRNRLAISERLLYRCYRCKELDAKDIYELANHDNLFSAKDQCLYMWTLFISMIIGSFFFFPVINSHYILLYFMYLYFMYLQLIKSLKYLHAKTITEYSTMPVGEAIKDGAISNYIIPFVVGGLSLATIGSIISLIVIFKRKLYEPQGNLCPVTEEDHIERNNEANVWRKRVNEHYVNPGTLTMTSKDLLNKVSKNAFHFCMETETTVKRVACLAICPKIVMFPFHFFHVDSDINKPLVNTSMYRGTIYRDIIKGTMVRKGGCNFVATITPSDIVRIGNSDLCLVHIANTGDLFDISSYITPDWNYTGPAVMGYRDTIGEWKSWACDCRQAEFQYSPDKGLSKVSLRGGHTTMGTESTRGMCTAPIISESSGPSIIGFHIAGYTGTTRGAYNTVLQNEVIQTKQELLDRTGILEAHGAATFKQERFGINIKYNPSLSSKAPINWLVDGDLVVRGDIDKQYSYWSEIRRTIMCPILEELTGSTCPYAGPQFGPETYKPFLAHLEKAASPGHCFSTQLLLRSKRDYVDGLLDSVEVYKRSYISICKPLTQKQIINGIHGIRFIDSMNMNASFGFPKGRKKKFYLGGEPGDYYFKNQYEIDIELDDMYSRYRNKERYYPIFKACLKDEPQKKDKFKVRVFHACDMTLQFALRKYYLPIARYFHMNPIISECAVGINPQCSEWHQMHDYITFGGRCDDRIVAGDYSGWDIRLPPDIVYMAFQILIDVARMMPAYSEDDILIMQGLATDVVNFSCHFNGTLIDFNAGVPSGHNLTALLNSICNSLLQRCGFFHSGGNGSFRDYVHTMTYGDDFWSGVLPGCDTHTHITYRDFLSQYDILLTMPNKTDVATQYMNIWECDFLKRRSVKSPYDNVIYGALDVTSINKSLMVKGKTSTSNRRHAYDVLFSALRELSYHDVDTYTYWSHIYCQIAEELQILFPGKGLTHQEYYYYRDGERKSDQDGIIFSNDYPMAEEAFENVIMITNLGDMPILEEDDSYELELLQTPYELTEQINNINSYRGTIIHEDSDSLNSHMEPHAETYGNVPPHQDAATLESGVLHMAGAKEEAVITTDLVSAELLSLRQHESRSLAQFLTRPMMIASYDIPAGQDYFFNPLPLRLFLSTPLIRDKIRNYAYLNGVLNIKVTSVGSPQIAGACHIALHPWWARDNGLGAAGLRTVTELTHCQMSQLPSFIIDFGAETGGHIRMPIVAPTNGLNISELDQIEDSFMLHIRGFVPTRIPPTSSVVPAIQVYAWIDEASLTGTTYRSELPVPQSDEFGKDPNDVGASTSVSFKDGLAAAAGNIVGKATEVGVSTMMSAMGLSAPLVPSGADPVVPRSTTNMACYNSQQNIDSLANDSKNQVELGTEELGFSDIDHMALSNIYKRWGHLGRLLVDLSGPTGQDSDIKVIPVSPLLASFSTAGSDIVYSPTPVAIATLPFAKWRGGLEFKFHAIGSAFLKGKVRISHDVNTRIKLGNEVRNFRDTQTLNSVIWDWSQYRTMTVQVPWTSNLAFKDTGLLRAPFATNGAWGTSETTFDSTNNGLLILEPLTKCSDLNFTEAYILVSIRGMDGLAYGDMKAPLTNYTFSGINTGQVPGVPEPQSDEVLKIPEGVRLDESGSPYFIFQTKENVMWMQDYLNSKYLEPQSDILAKKADVTTFGGQVSQTEMVVNIAGLENNLEDNDRMAMACMGEKFFSIRQIIKRYTHNWTRQLPAVNNGGVSMHRFRVPDRPLLKGWQGPTSINIDPNGKRCTYARDSFLSFFSVCFLGYRGSFRHKIMITTNDGTTRSNLVVVARTAAGGLFYEKLPYSNTDLNQSASAILTAPDMRAGGTLGVIYQAPVLEYSTPFQCRAKFAWAQDRTPLNSKFTYDGGFDIPWHQITATIPEVPGKWFRIDKYIAAGDDFSLFFYMYAPLMLDRSPGAFPQ